MKKVLVIGAGAAGLMAAGFAASNGNNVVLVEKNNVVGKKLAITGKGRCNVTNSADVEEIIANTPGNGSFLYSSLYTYTNEDIMNFFEKRGVKLKVERGGRVFPESDRAIDIVNALKDFAIKTGVEIVYNAEVVDIEVVMTDEGKKVSRVVLKDKSEFEVDSVIIATGGVSYPGTGSNGAGHKFAKKLGHTIVDLKPSLIPLLSNTKWVSELQGLSLKNVKVTFFNAKGKKIYDDFGEMIFTHYGVSGPVILSASRHLLDYDYKDITMHIDLKPALDFEKLDARLIREFEKYSKKNFSNSLGELLPNKLIDVFIRLSEISPDKKVEHINKKERHKIAQLLKNLTLTIDGARPINEAIVTAGGVKTSEINSSTMESKLVKGLFFAGEVIDVDAYTGGYNLTIAFSTAHLAGMNC